MNKLLLLSNPVFDTPSFFEFANIILNADSKVFIINYANEPKMLFKRFNRIGTPEITKKYIDELYEKLEFFSIPRENIILSSDDDTLSCFMEKFNQSEVLIFCGGAAESLLDKLEVLGVTDLIKNSNKSAIAYSAGAEIFLDFLTLLPSSFWQNAGNYYKVLSTRKALGFVNGLVLAFHHTDSRDDDIQKICNSLNSRIVALSDEDGVFVENEDMTWIGNPKIFTPLGD